MPATPVVSPSTSFREEKKEFDEEQLKIEKEFELIQNARVDLYENEMKLKKRVAQQLKSLSSLEKQVKSSSSSCVPANNNNTPTATKTETATAASTNEETTIITELEHSKDSLQKYNTEILNPGSKFLQMFLGSVNSVVLNGHASRRYKFKQEYEDFKRKCTLWNIPVAFLLLILFQSRAIDTIYQIWLAYFYLTLAMRESILQVNGSRINKWWINHHYLSVLLVTTLITWPKTMIYQQFRSQFFIYSFYSSIVQLLQYQYQTQRLYVMKTLGKANQMDVANSDSTQVVFSRQFIFLLPFVFIGQLMQFYNAICLLFWCWRANEWQEWQAYLVAAEFFVLAYGNFVTTVRIFKKKYRKYQNQKSE